MRFPNKATEIVLALMGALVLGANADAEIIRVPEDYSSIQQAIDLSSTGDAIFVAPGVYNEVIDFLGKNITVLGVEGPDATIIDGSGLHDSVVKFNSGEGSATLLHGFTITDGTGYVAFPKTNPGFTHGGGLYVSASSPAIIGCRLAWNTADVGGGAFFSNSNSPILYCEFRGNHGGGAGGIYLRGQANGQSLSSVLFVGNSTESRGAAAFLCGGNYILNGLTFTENVGPGVAGGATVSVACSATLALSNTVMWANDAFEEISGTPGTAIIGHCDIQGGISAVNIPNLTWAEGNIAEDPLFTEGYRLYGVSPCIDAGDNDAAGGLDKDLAGNPRIVDGDGDGAATVDMGAYEFQGCLPDLTGDNVVNVPDLIELLSAWGPNPTHPADFDGDGQVRVPDLVVLLAAWGACPK